MSSTDNQDTVDRLVEEFMDRQQNGEAPSIDEYCQRHPELAEEIRDVFEALMMVEDLKPGSHDGSGTFGNSVPIGQRPDQVGDYRILSEIGRGGMGIVYEAEQLSLGRRVAVKVLPQQIAGSGKALARFQREAKAAARMHHTNIVPVFEVGTASEHVFYAMQLIQGQGLDLVIDDLQRMRQLSSDEAGNRTGGDPRASEHSPRDAVPSIAHSLVSGHFEQVRLDGRGQADAGAAVDQNAYQLTETIALKSGSNTSAALPGKSDISTAEEDRHAYHISVAEIGQQTAAALAYAHARGIIHRDIKPSNLLLDSAGIVWVTDFGLAKTGEEALTHTGDILGTIRYMSPERFRGQCDVRADIYSLGLTLYELITLKPAFYASDQGSLIGIINDSDPVTPRSIDPRVPRDLETIVLKAIDKEPRRRYQSADEMEEDLQRFIDDEPIKARRISLVERFTRWSRRNKALAASLSVAATLMLVINIAGPVMTWQMKNLNRQLSLTVASLESKETELREEQKSTADALGVALEQRNAVQEASEIIEQQNKQAISNLYAFRIAAAARALETPGGYREYQNLLAQTRPQPDAPDHRGWEWFFLNTPHNDGVESIATDAEQPDVVRFSPDGKKLAYAGSSGMITIRDMEADRNLFAFSAHDDRILGLAWSPDGQQVVSGGSDHAVRIWDAATGLEQLAFSDLDQQVAAVAWSPDGAKIAAGDRAGGLYVWDTNTWRAWGKTREPSTRQISEVCWNPDSRRLLTADMAGKLIVWDVETGVSTPLENGRRTEMTRSINWTAAGYNPQGNLIAAVDDLGLLTVWQEDTDTGEISTLGRLQAHSSQVGQLSWDPRPDSQRFATVCVDGTVTVWNASIPSTPERVRTHQHGHSAHDVSWDSQHDRLAFASRTESISVWNLDESVRPNGIETNARWVGSVAYSSDEKWIASAGGSRGPGWGPDLLQVHNRGTNESERLKIDANSRVLDLAFSPDGKWLATGDTSNNLILWNTTTWNPIHIESAKDTIFCLAWSLDGKTIATGTANRNPFGNRPHPIVHTITLWNVSDDGQLSQSWNSEQQGAVRDLTFHPKDNTRLAAAVVKRSDAGSTSSILIWDTGRGSDPISSMTMPEESISCLLWHPEDADRLATASMKETYDDSVGTLRIFDVTNWQEVQQMTGHNNRISSMTWNKDGTRLLSGGWDGTVRLWQPETGTELLKIPSDRIILGVALSPCDFQIAATGSGSAIDVYDATQGYLRDRSPKILEHGGRLAMGRDANANDLLTRAELHLQSRPPNWDAADRDFYLAADRSQENGPGWIQSPWWVVGPYPFPDASTAKSPPEQQLPTVNVAQSVLAADGDTQLFWQQVERQNDHGIDFSRHFDRSATESCYATCNIYASEDMSVGVMFGARSHHRLWLNGEVVHESQTDGQIAPRDYVRLVSLKAGRNTLLMRIANRSGNHAMFLEISDNPSVLADAFEHTTGESPDYAAALRQWKLALNEEPNRADLLLRHSRAAQMLGDFKTALDSLSSLLDVYDREGSTPPIEIQLEKGELHAFSELNRRTPIPEGSIWKWLHPINGISPTASIPSFNRDFSQLEFDDRNWNMGRDSTDLGGGFRGGYPHEAKAIDIGTPPSGTVSSAYFRCMFTTFEPLERLAIQMRMNDGVIVYLDGQEIGRNNIANEENEDFRLTTQEAVTERIATFSPRTQLAVGKHVLAISLHGIGPANTNYLLANISLSGSSGPISRPLSLDDPAVLLGRGLTYAELGQPDRATADIALAVEKIRQQPNENWRPQLMQAVANRLASRPSPNIASELLAPVVDLLPESRPLQLQLALAAVREQRWKKVAISMGEAVRLAPNAHVEACQLCAVLIHNNDLDGYRKLRSKMLERWQGTLSRGIAQRVARASLLLPAEDDELTVAGNLADLAFSALPEKEKTSKTWFAVTKGLAEYRRGNFESAVQQLEHDSANVINLGQTSRTKDLLLAMCHHQLGHLVDAKRLLQTARHSIEQDFSPDLVSYDNQLMCLILLREAEELISGK